MAANLRNNAFLSSLMLLLLIGSSYAITSSQITAICDKSLNPFFCIKFLNTKFASPDLKALAKTTFEILLTKATQTHKRLRSLIDGGVDPRTKLAYTTCSDQYEMAIGNLEESFDLLASGDNMGVNMRASAALDGADQCLEDVKRLRSVDASIVNNSKAIKKIAGIALVIANMLPRRA